MLVYSHNYVTLMDVCKYNDMDYGDVMESICHSDISFGTNEDTLISRAMLESVLETDLEWNGLNDDVLISLGS